MKDLIKSMKAAAERAGGGKWEHSWASVFSRHYITDSAGNTVINLTGGDVPAKYVPFFELANPENVLDLIHEVNKYKTAFEEFHDKTEWVQKDKRFDVVSPWGKHRADVLREYIEHLLDVLVARNKRLEEEIERGNREHHRGFILATGHMKEHENVHYADAAEMEIAALRQRIRELEEKQRLIDICQGQGLEHRIAAEKRAEEAENRIAELEASHSKLRATIAAIHNTIRMDGSYTPLAAILNNAKRAYEESATAAGIKDGEK